MKVTRLVSRSSATCTNARATPPAIKPLAADVEAPKLAGGASTLLV